MSERTHGPRFAPGGYQGPRTNAVQITRGQPLRSLKWTIGTAQITLKIVPLHGGRPELFEIEYQLNDRMIGHSVYNPCMVRGEDWARQAFELTAREFDAGNIPDAVVVPPDMPLGW